MTDFQKLQAEVARLTKVVAQLQKQMKQTTEFEETFSGVLIINKEVQFKKRVYDKNNNVVTEINT